MRIVVFGGTTEGRVLSHRLAAAGAAVTVCVATPYGDEEQGSAPGIETRIGPMSAEEKQALLQDAALCVDATHPYATHVTKSVREACERAGVEYLRLKRGESGTGGALSFESAHAAAKWLEHRKGNILLTTGAKELGAFKEINPGRIFPRVLPSVEAIRACEAVGIPHRNIIAMQGPFTREMNAATIRQYDIRTLVTKDGGGPGGFPEKAAAARDTGALLLVLRRPEDEGLDYEEVLNLCMTRLRDANRFCLEGEKQ